MLKQLLHREAEIRHLTLCPAMKPHPSKPFCTCCSNYKPLFREKVLGRVGVLQAIEVLGFCTQEIRHLSLPLVSLSDKKDVCGSILISLGALTPEQEYLPSVWFNVVIPKYGVFHLQNHTLL